MSIEEEARQKNKSFWEVKPEMDDAEAAELARAGNANFQLEMDTVEDTSGDGEATTTNGGDHTDIGVDPDHTDVGDGGNPPPAKKPKKQRKDRTPQAVATVTTRSPRSP